MLNTMNTNRISRMNHLFTSAFLLGISSHSWGQIITTVAGGGVGDGGPAAQANLSGPRGVAVDAAGNLYIADQDNHRVRRVDAVTGTITTVVGTGGREFSGDGGSASLAGLGFPAGISVDGSGNLYIADFYNNRIRRVDTTTGIITTVAGSGATGFRGSPGIIPRFSGDGGAATEAELTGPRGVSVDGAGHLYIADTSNSRIRRVDADTGIITTVAGNGREYSGDGGAAIEAGMGYPTSVVVDGSGHLYIADTFSNRIRRVDGVTGVITTVAGNGRYEFSGDGGAATEAGTTEPSGVSVDRDGTLYIAEHNRIRRVDAVTGVITTVAGRGEFDFSAGGDPEVGDGGPATEAYLLDPSGVFVDGGGHLYIADAFNNRIRRVDADTGVITTVAGSEGFLGDHGLATEARLDQPSGVFADGAGHLYIADHDNHRIRLVNKSTGIITTVAGTGVRGFSGDGGLATKAGLSWPKAVFVDGAGHLYISHANRVRRVDAVTGIITTVAGNGARGFSGDGGPAIEAELFAPHGLFVDGASNLYIADLVNSRIRRVDGATGIITTVAGRGDIFADGGEPDGQMGDGGAATEAYLLEPEGVFVDGAGNIYIADTFNNRVRRVDAETGVITTVAGTGAGAGMVVKAVVNGPSQDDGSNGTPATEIRLEGPAGVAVDGNGNLYIADKWNNQIRRVDATTGFITTIAGSGNDGGFSGDGGPAVQAKLRAPHGLSIDAAGNLYIADTWNHRIRKITITPTAVVDEVKPDQTPTSFAMEQNYPNPFNPHTAIRYQLDHAGPVSLTIYNMLGQRIRVLVHQPQAAGSYEVPWDSKDASGREVSSGMYLYRLASGQGVLSRRMVRLK